MLGGPSVWAIIHVSEYEYCFTSLSAQSWQYRDRRKPKAGTMPYSYFNWLQGLFIVHSTIGSTVHSMHLNSLEHCICTTTMTNIRTNRNSNLAPPGHKPRPIRMSHRGRPYICKSTGEGGFMCGETLNNKKKNRGDGHCTAQKTHQIGFHKSSSLNLFLLYSFFWETPPAQAIWVCINRRFVFTRVSILKWKVCCTTTATCMFHKQPSISKNMN